jgi:hypothetical protein
MLGSAQCQRCGANVLTGVVETPPSPTPAPTRRQGARTPNPAEKGCGCAVPAVLALVAALGVGSAVVVRVIGDDDAGDVQLEGRIRPGEAGEGGIGSGESDRWDLVDVETGPYVVTVDGHGGFDPKVEVLDAGGSLGANDDVDGGRDSRLAVDLEAGVAYEVVVTGFGDSSGDYDLEVTSAAVDRGAVRRGDPVAARLGAGQVARHGITGEGLPVTVAVRGQDGFDAVLRVVAADGTVLGDADDTEGHDPVLDVVVPGGQQAVLEVREYSGRAGSYTVEVT